MTLIEANRLVSFGLVVLIWLVQLVIYPAFAEIDPGKFVAWHSRYTRAITWIVGPLMLGQAIAMGRLVAIRPRIPNILAAILVAVCWAVTARVAVPLHEMLQSGGHHEARIRHLVKINWIRTVAWSLAFLLLWI